MRGITCPAAATSAMIHSFPHCHRALLTQQWLAPPQRLQDTCRWTLPSVHPHSCRNLTASAARNAKRGKGAGSGSGGDGQLIQVEEDGSDAWRLEPALEAIRSGQVVVLPTDTFPAFVCDVGDRAAVQRLYEIKEMSASQPLSILCRNWQDISAYTLGFPAANGPGQQDTFRLARQILPGPYTLILLASKALPKQCVDYISGKVKTRRTVGVRLVDAPVCQAALQQLDRPLLCSSIRPNDSLNGELPDGAVLLDQYAPRGLAFVVDNGRRFAEGSSVVDMTVNPPEVVRRGAGDVSLFSDEREAVGSL